MKTSQTIKCPYCGSNAVLRNASYVYGDNAIPSRLYVCSNYPRCNSYVGVHEGTLTPKGTLANGELRHKRIEAHHIFDLIRKNGIMTKKNAYLWMQVKFGLSKDKAHIAKFNESMCDRLIAESRKLLLANNLKLGGAVNE